MQSLLSEIRKQGEDGDESSAPNHLLRHVPQEDRRDRSSAAASALMMVETSAAEDDQEHQEKTVKYFVDSGCSTWYDDIKEITFTSSFCDLTKDEARIIIEHYEQQRALVAANPSARTTTTAEDIFKVACEKLKPLQKRLAATLDCEVGKSPVRRAFVKLSTRSPKDSKKALQRAKLAYRARVTAQERAGDVISENERWIMLSEEVSKSLAIETPEEAVELLLDSERVYEDLRYVLDAPNTKAKADGKTQSSNDDNTQQPSPELWNMQIVARSWDPRLTPASELRGICWNGKLTCLCQYFHPLHFPRLAEMKDQMQEDVQRTFDRDEVRRAVERLGGHCIVDFAWLEPNKVIIIELNPFDGVSLGTFPASTGLFLWDDPADRRIMTGEAPFEFRIREQPADSHELKNNCSRAWRSIIYEKDNSK